jgi:hypothetical protein
MATGAVCSRSGRSARTAQRHRLTVFIVPLSLHFCFFCADWFPFCVSPSAPELFRILSQVDVGSLLAALQSRLAAVSAVQSAAAANATALQATVAAQAAQIAALQAADGAVNSAARGADYAGHRSGDGGRRTDEPRDGRGKRGDGAGRPSHGG